MKNTDRSKHNNDGVQDKNENKPVYDQWGINEEFNDPRSKGVKEADIEAANKYAEYWYYENGLNVVPCVSYKKTLYLMEYKKYHNEDMPEDLFKHLLDTGVFYYGIAAVTGIIRRGENKGKYFNAIDFDNLKGRNIMLTDSNGVVHTLDELAEKTIVETNKGSPGIGHVFYVTERPLATKQAEGDDSKPKLEIYCGKHVMLVANSYKTEKFEGGAINRTKILKMEKQFTRLPLYLNSEQTEIFEKEIDEKLARFGIPYLNKKKNSKSGKPEETFDEILDENNKVLAGGNRQLRVLKICDRLLLDLYKRHSICTLEDIKEIARKKCDIICDPPLETWKFEQKWKEAVQWTGQIIGPVEGEEELIKELEDLGVVPSDNITAESLPDYVKELDELIDEMKTTYESPIDIDVATETIRQKYHFKTMEDTHEMVYFNGKHYTKYGDSMIEKELELMQSEERRRLNRMLEIKDELSRMIIQRRNAGMDSFELERYEYELVIKSHEELFRQLKVRNNFRSEVVHKINVQTRIDRGVFAVDPDKIIVNNGILDLHRKKIKINVDGIEHETEGLSWTLGQHSPEVLSLNMFPVNYDPKAICPNFVKALLQVCQYDLRLYINTIKMLGYCIYQTCEFQCAFMLYGLGDNMKSVILRVIQKLIGLENVCNIPVHDLCGDDKFFAAQLFGKTANIYADIPFHKIKNSSKFKATVAGDRIEGQYKNQPSFYFEPYAKQIYSTNRIPDSEDNTFAWFKRWVLLHYKVRIPKHLQDRQLVNKVTTPEELSGIFNLALKGLKLLLRDGGFNVGNITAIKKEYEKQSSLVKEFVMENYQVDVGNESKEYCVLTEKVQTDFINFLKEDEGERSQYIQSELVNSGLKDREINLDNKIDRWIAISLLGRELAAMDIDNRQKLDAKTKTRPHYYVGLRPRVGPDGKPLDAFGKSTLIRN